VVEQAVKHGGDGRGIAEEPAPVVDGPVRGDHRAGPFVAAHDEFEQVLGGAGGELAHAQVIHEQRHAAELCQVLLAAAVEGGVGELLEQDVRLSRPFASERNGSRRRTVYEPFSVFVTQRSLR
jgi:hypothetical protein